MIFALEKGVLLNKYETRGTSYSSNVTNKKVVRVKCNTLEVKRERKKQRRERERDNVKKKTDVKKLTSNDVIAVNGTEWFLTADMLNRMYFLEESFNYPLNKLISVLNYNCFSVENFFKVMLSF